MNNQSNESEILVDDISNEEGHPESHHLHSSNSYPSSCQRDALDNLERERALEESSLRVPR